MIDIQEFCDSIEDYVIDYMSYASGPEGKLESLINAYDYSVYKDVSDSLRDYFSDGNIIEYCQQYDLTESSSSEEILTNFNLRLGSYQQNNRIDSHVPPEHKMKALFKKGFHFVTIYHYMVPYIKSVIKTYEVTVGEIHD